MNGTTDAIVNLGRLSLAFGRVNRITYHPDGATPESDTDHTVMLGLVACAFAERYAPGLDVGLVAQFALVHDLVEAYAGDTPTLRMLDGDAKAAKARREHVAYLRIAEEFAATLPWVPTRIAEYEERRTPEARFVKALDKLLPKITHILNGSVTLHEQGVAPKELADRYAAQREELASYVADFPDVLDLHAELVSRTLACFATPAVPAAVSP